MVSFLMLAVSGWIVEHRWRLLIGGPLAQRFVIGLEQRNDHRGHLTSYPSNDTQLPTIVLCTFIVDGL